MDADSESIRRDHDRMTRCSLFVTRCSALVTRCSRRVTRRSPLGTRYSRRDRSVQPRRDPTRLFDRALTRAHLCISVSRLFVSRARAGVRARHLFSDTSNAAGARSHLSTAPSHLPTAPSDPVAAQFHPDAARSHPAGAPRLSVTARGHLFVQRAFFSLHRATISWCGRRRSRHRVSPRHAERSRPRIAAFLLRVRVIRLSRGVSFAQCASSIASPARCKACKSRYRRSRSSTLSCTRRALSRDATAFSRAVSTFRFN